MKDIVIAGFGGMGRETEFLIERINRENPYWNFLGYIENDISGENIIGDDDFVCEYQNELYVVIAIGSGTLRSKLYNRYSTNPNIKFPNLIDPSVIMSQDISLGIGNIICANSILTVDVTIGDFNIINLATTLAHDVQVGSFNIINATSCLTGQVEVGDFTEIGTGTKVIPGKKVGNYVKIGAGAVVIDDLPEGCTAVGVPAKVIKVK